MGFVGFIAYKESSRDPVFKIQSSQQSSPLDHSQLRPIPPEQYAYANVQQAHDHGEPIDLSKENAEVSRYIQSLNNQSRLSFLIVPGFIPPFGEAMSLNATMKKRLNWAVKLMQEGEASVILVSGGNVKPEGTPFNEALEMKKHLMAFHKVPERFIAIDPYAQNTVTNLRNAGRFMLAHDIKRAKVVTTFVQNIYVGFPTLTLFLWRSRWLLGFEVGKLSYIDERQTAFKPSLKVFQKGPSKVDP